MDSSEQIVLQGFHHKRNLTREKSIEQDLSVVAGVEILCVTSVFPLCLPGDICLVYIHYRDTEDTEDSEVAQRVVGGYGLPLPAPACFQSVFIRTAFSEGVSSTLLSKPDT